jgi:hypothetical protein
LSDRELRADIEKLFAGWRPRPAMLESATKLSWWWVERCWRTTGENNLEFKAMTVCGARGIHSPRPVTRFSVTGWLCWMDSEFRWCRCEDGWYRLGEVGVRIDGR